MEGRQAAKRVTSLPINSVTSFHKGANTMNSISQLSCNEVWCCSRPFLAAAVFREAIFLEAEK